MKSKAEKYLSKKKVGTDFIDDARNNQIIASTLYRRVFYDGNVPKLRRWLVRKGIPFHMLDELESQMRETFAIGLTIYKHSKIPFEQWIWVRFSQTLLNYWQSMKFIKNANKDYVEEVILVNQMAFSYDPEEMIHEIDLQNIIRSLPVNHREICTDLLAGKTKHEIMNKFGLTSVKYDVELHTIREKFKQYLQTL